jgi:N-methylhydantoinase B/oxoprolinase/acetone carboxylase alpha subunit
MTTTIAVKESTRDKLRRIMKEEGAQSLDQTINFLMEKAERVPKSMFGADKPKAIQLSSHEHEEFQR